MMPLITTRAVGPAFALIGWLLLPLTGHGFYSSTTGRWLARDPLGEQAFLDDYVAVGHGPAEKDLRRQSLLPPYLLVRNSPANRPDILGLYDDCCCTPTVVGLAQRILSLRYSIAQLYLDPHRPRSMPEEGSWSCLSVAMNIGHFMAKIPPCWTCYVEQRWGRWRPGGAHDLNVVVCTSHPRRGTGASKKIYFDYWHHAPPAQDYSVFLKRFPYPGSVMANLPKADCRTPSLNWTPAWGWLDLVIAGP